MQRLYGLLFLLFSAGVSRAQNCGCVQDLDFTVRYLEKNMPGFADNVTPANRKTYENFKRTIRQAAATNPPQNICLKYLTTYVEYFRDSHTTIGANSKGVDEQKPEEIARFLASPEYKATEIVRLDTTRRATAATDPLEGYYQTPDGTYRVYLAKSKTKFRDYAAVIVASRTPLWRPGQVKFELRRTTSASTFEAYQYQRNHSLYYVPNVRYLQGQLRGLNWLKTSETNPFPPPAGNRLEFKIIATDTVAYLRIPSFSGEQFTRLDSLYRAITPQIQRTKYLIIDVRDNGGGSDRNVAPLLPFFYAQPIQETQIEEYYVTADNLRRYEEYLRQMQADSVRYGSTAIWSFKEKVAWMRRAPLNSFITNPHSENKTYTMEPATLPAKVAILYNRGCASSCETLLIWAKQPSKAVLVGENSGGYVAYGNVLPVQTPCYNFTLNVTTMRLKNQLAYEAIGIEPAVHLRDDQDWLQQTIQILLRNEQK
ncbi:S41 family peptidase [Hymenobacter elongatus]|uniref:Tail specific protease domain-containing protein n=1 Tax=Hymenobacter elongatus TaxID=877208 RepID=A0A4Z0PM56_9BACT|nr:S41 family peptidase [Hymenobacter elongatus]TGE15809.1 hypothetical protein E5J99_11465 [Hymenobacter elongatus]